MLAASAPPPRPRRLWEVSDTSLRSIPKFYPKLNPRTTAFVSDASPSVVAVRISECLRKRSIAVEYDEEAVTATAMTSDRSQFTIYLYKGNSQPIDFSYGVVVECQRVAGSPLTFHRTVHAVLAAAQGMSTGEDKRKSHFASVMELRRHQIIGESPAAKQQAASPSSSSSKQSTAAQRGLEHARALLKKDRFECQQLGMESLVALTTSTTSGAEITTQIASSIIQNDWIHSYLIMRDEKTDIEPNHSIANNASSLISACTSSLRDGESAHTMHTTSKVSEEEAKQEGILRAGALRVLANSLQHLAKHHPKSLHRMMQPYNAPITSVPLLQALARDLKGANRPVSVAANTRLASAHEAALAVCCLRIMGQHSSTVQNFLQADFVMESLELARSCGRSTHVILEQEAEATYHQLTEDARSC